MLKISHRWLTSCRRGVYPTVGKFDSKICNLSLTTLPQPLLKEGLIQEIKDVIEPNLDLRKRQVQHAEVLPGSGVSPHSLFT